MEPQPLIGILAGMGARSTAPFVDLVIDECQRQYGASDEIDFPPMMIYSLPTPFVLGRPVDHRAMEETVRGGLARLAATGVRFVAMPCNTVHIYYDALAASLDVPLLHMVDEAAAAMPPAAAKVAVLATRPTVAAGLYQSRLRQRGFEVVEAESRQLQVDGLLDAIKSSPERAHAQSLWSELLQGAAADGLDTLVVACTDLNAVDIAGSDGVRVVDATLCLAAAVVRRWLGLRGAVESEVEGSGRIAR